MATAETHTPFAILVVEDDNLVCESVSRILKLEFPEATVYFAENGRAGLEQFIAHIPDIVITDINMPVMNGLEMARKITSVSPETKFIVVTGYFDKEHLEQGSEVGYVEYLVKPLEFTLLFDAIKKCLPRRSKITPATK